MFFIIYNFKICLVWMQKKKKAMSISVSSLDHLPCNLYSLGTWSMGLIYRWAKIWEFENLSWIPGHRKTESPNINLAHFTYLPEHCSVWFLSPVVQFSTKKFRMNSIQWFKNKMNPSLKGWEVSSCLYVCK